MSYTSDTLQCILNIRQTQINVLVIQCQTHLGKIFKCTIFVGYGGVINFEWCRTIYVFDIYVFENTNYTFLKGHWGKTQFNDTFSV